VRRLFWVALGATAGVLVVRRLTKVAHSYTPAGLAESLSKVGDAVRDFGDRVSLAMAEREVELRDALGIDEGADHGIHEGTFQHRNEGMHR
jgi:hypothetical protein